MGNLLRIARVALLLVASLTLWVGLPSAAVSPVFTSLGRVSQGLAIPGAIDVDAAGNLYVTDARQGILLKYDVYGKLRERFEQALVSGRGLGVTTDGRFLYASTASGVARLDAVSGALLNSIGSTDSPVPIGLAGSLAVDGDGTVYVADLLSCEVLTFTESGNFLQRLGGKGTGPGKFGAINAVAIVGNRLLVADNSTANLKVEVFSLDGQYLATLPTGAGFGPTPLHVPRGMLADDQGRLYFLEFSGSSVRFLDSQSYAYLGTFSRTGKAVGELEYVKDLAYDTLNRRLFVSCDGGRVEIYGVDGGTAPVYVNHPPTAPAPLSPVGGSVVASETPVLSYTAATDEEGNAVYYRVTILSGDVVVFTAEAPATFVTVSSGVLAENAAYTWSVQAFDSEGEASAASTAAFVVNAVNEPPSPPVLITPLTGEILAGPGQLSWQAAVDPDPVPNQVSYRVEVAADAGFSPVIASGSLSGTAVSLAELDGYLALVDGNTYVWRVTALDGEGNSSKSEQAGWFIYDTALLRVTANMPGASVYIAGNHAYPGRHVGTVPMELRDLTDGAYAVVVERSGFEPYVTRIVIAGNDNTTVYAPLEPARQPAGPQPVANGLKGLAVGGAAAPFLVDFDNDGQLDLLVGNGGGLILFPGMQWTSRGPLTFQPGKALALPVIPGAVPFMADWDNDGRKDLLVGLADGTIKLFLNTGLETAPAFGTGQDLIVAGSILNVGGDAAPIVIDLDSDGNKDLVVGNSAGQVSAFYNQGTDAEPQLAAPVLLARLAGPAIPASVDWDADGERDLLVTVNGQAVPLRNDLVASGTFVAGEPIPIPGAYSVFPVDIDGVRGKDLIVGQVDGKLAFWKGNGMTLTAAAVAGLLDKVAEVRVLVEADEPALVGEVDKLYRQIQGGRFALAARTASSLAEQLPAGAAKNATEELAALCRK